MTNETTDKTIRNMILSDKTEEFSGTTAICQKLLTIKEEEGISKFLEESFRACVAKNNTLLLRFMLDLGFRPGNHAQLFERQLLDNFSVEKVLILLSHSDFSLSEDTYSRILWATIQSNTTTNTLLIALLNRNVNINLRAPGTHSTTVLIETVKTENINNICTLLKSNKVDINERDILNSTVCFYAKTTIIMDILLNHGADPNIKNNMGRTILTTLLLETYGNRSINIPLILCLLQHGAHILPDIVYKCRDVGLLHLIVKEAVARGDRDILCGDKGSYILQTAIKLEKIDLVAYLLKYGVDPNGNPSRISLCPKTALQQACVAANENILKVFLELVPEKLDYDMLITRALSYEYVKHIELLAAARPDIITRNRFRKNIWLHKNYFTQHGLKSCYFNKRTKYSCLGCNKSLCNRCTNGLVNCLYCGRILFCSSCQATKSSAGYFNFKKLDEYTENYMLACHYCIKGDVFIVSMRNILLLHQSRGNFIDCVILFH